MTEPLPEKIQEQLKVTRLRIIDWDLDRLELHNLIGIMVLNAYNLGKDPAFEIIPIT